MNKIRLATLLAAGALFLGSCDGANIIGGGSSAEEETATSEVDTGGTDTSEDTDVASSDSGDGVDTDDPGEDTSSSDEPAGPYWTDEDLALMDEYLGGHVIPFFDTEALGLSYTLMPYEDEDILLYAVPNANMAVVEAYVEVQTAVYEDLSESMGYGTSGEPLWFLQADFDDYCYVQQEVALADEGFNFLTDDDAVGYLYGIFYPAIAYHSWPEEEISELMEEYLGDYTDLDSIPHPGDFDSGFVYYLDTTSSRSRFTINVLGDFTGYGEVLTAAGYARKTLINIGNGYDTYASPDGTIFVGIGDYEDGMTPIRIQANTDYIVNWPSEIIDDFLAGIFGIDEFTPLPALEGAEFYEVYESGTGELDMDIICYGIGAAEEYVQTLLDNGFDRFGSSDAYDGYICGNSDAKDYLVTVESWSNLVTSITQIQILPWESLERI